MGTWGAGLYQNDLTEDVKIEFQRMFNEQGMDEVSITEKLKEDYKAAIGDVDEEPLFWLALAETQWRYGVLMPEVKEKALDWLHRGVRLRDEQIIDQKKAHKKWPITLKTLEEKLNSPLPKRRKPHVKKEKQWLWPCDWKIGDVYAYPLTNETAQDKGLYGRILLIRMIEEVIFSDCSCPIVYIKITKDALMPTSAEEYEQLEYVQTDFTRYEDRFFPLHFARLEEDLKAKMALKYELDEYGFLPQYRAIILNTSKGELPTQLFYWGRIEEAAPPQGEFVPIDVDRNMIVTWKDFENELVKKYCYHNRRELSIYHKDAE